MSSAARLLQSDPIYAGPVFSVRRDRVRLGGKPQVFDLIEHPGSYAVVARPDAATIVLVRQFRYPANQALWELPAGKADPGEDAQAGALRELREETGFRAGRIQELFTLYMTPGFCNERLQFFLADDLSAGPTSFDADERIETRVFPIDKALALLASREIVDAKTAIGLLWLYQQASE